MAHGPTDNRGTFDGYSDVAEIGGLIHRYSLFFVPATDVYLILLDGLYPVGDEYRATILWHTFRYANKRVEVELSEDKEKILNIVIPSIEGPHIKYKVRSSERLSKRG